jgi:hypothetical protein
MEEDQYICVGICMSDPDSGYCLGCGRPPLGSPDVVVEVMAPTPAEQISADEDPDSPA